MRARLQCFLPRDCNFFCTAAEFVDSCSSGTFWVPDLLIFLMNSKFSFSCCFSATHPLVWTKHYFQLFNSIIISFFCCCWLFPAVIFWALVSRQGCLSLHLIFGSLGSIISSQFPSLHSSCSDQCRFLFLLVSSFKVLLKFPLFSLLFSTYYSVNAVISSSLLVHNWVAVFAIKRSFLHRKGQCT